MHPLLVGAVANTAGHFLDRWARGAATPPPSRTPDASFGQMLEASSAPTAARPAEKSPAEMRRERTLELGIDLLDAPEIRAVLDTADPAKPPKLTLTTDGRVLVAQPGRDARPLLLSPETADTARALASLSATSGSLALPGGAGATSSLQQARVAGYELTPKASFAGSR